MAKKRGKPVEVSAEKKARAEKMRKEGKSYKQIADALNLGYDKAAWNLLNSGPTGKKRGQPKPKAEPVKGKGKAAKAAPADKGVEAAGRSKTRGKRGQKSAGKAPEESTQEAPAEASNGSAGPEHKLQLGTFGKSSDRPVARPAEEVKAVPKPKDRKLSTREKSMDRIGKLAKGG